MKLSARNVLKGKVKSIHLAFTDGSHGIVTWPKLPGSA
jgi:molybdopterin-binding protein